MLDLLHKILIAVSYTHLPCKLLRGNHKRCPFFISNQNEIDIRNELNNMDSEISSEIKVLRYLIENKKNLIGYRDAYRTTCLLYTSRCV